MALTNIVYILPMILGRTFDARNDRVGIDIFPPSELDKALDTNHHKFDAKYRIIASTENVRSLIDIDGDLSLKIKAGNVDLRGIGKYLKDSTSASRTVEILTRMRFTTHSVNLRNPKPIEDWRSKRKEDLGTHYVSSITYGGELLATVRFRAHKESNITTINAAVTGTFSQGEATDLVVKGRLEKLQEDLKSNATMEITYYATVPLNGVPNTIEGLRDLVRNFEDHTKEVNSGSGVPIRVELAPLSGLEDTESRFEFKENSNLKAALIKFEEMFDDLREARARLNSWIQSLPALVVIEHQEKINAFHERIGTVLRKFYDVIGMLNVEDDDQQLQLAQEAYKQGKLKHRSFSQEFNKLIEEIDTTAKKLHGVGTAAYVRWGAEECPPQSPMTVKLSTGYIASSTSRGIGGGSQYLCMPREPNNADLPFFGAKTSSHIAGVRYIAPKLYGHGAACSICHITNRTLVNVFPGHSICPAGWIAEYSGHIMTGTIDPSVQICVDDDLQNYYIETDEKYIPYFGLVYMSDSEEKKAVKCIVCSK